VRVPAHLGDDRVFAGRSGVAEGGPAVRRAIVYALGICMTFTALA
jgi:hypothetical protein